MPAEEVIGQEQETGSAPLNPRDIRARPLLGVQSSRLSNCQIKRVIPEQDTTSLQVNSKLFQNQNALQWDEYRPLVAGSLEAAYPLNWGAQKIWGKGGGETLALL